MQQRVELLTDNKIQELQDGSKYLGQLEKNELPLTVHVLDYGPIKPLTNF